MQVKVILLVHRRKNVDLTSREYSYKGLRFRAYCDRQGKNGRLVLEDIVGILLELSNDSREPKKVTLEQLEQINIETTEYDGVHLATADSMLDFFLASDNLSNVDDPTEYEELGELLANRMTEILEKDMVILGKTAFLIPEWRKAAIQITNEDWSEVMGESGKISLRTWVERTYKLEVIWVGNWVVNKYRNVISPTFRTTSGVRAEKDNSRNMFEPHEFAVIEPLVTNYLSNDDGEWRYDISVKSQNSKSENFQKRRQDIGRLKTDGASVEEIIQKVFDVTPESHVVEKYRRNYLYEALEIFVRYTPKQK